MVDYGSGSEQGAVFHEDESEKAALLQHQADVERHRQEHVIAGTSTEGDSHQHDEEGNEVSDKDRSYDPAVIYEDASCLRRSWIRIFALIATMLLEFIPAFVIANGAGQLEGVMNPAEKDVFIGFASVVSAVAGNVGLQASSATTRAISRLFVGRYNWGTYMLKELRVGLLLSAVLCPLLFAGCMIAMYVAADGSINPEAGMVLALAQFASIASAQVTGVGGPILFKIYLKRDPAGWAGPLETAFQDLIGTLFNFVLGKYVFIFFWSLFHWNWEFVGPYV